tara:strand:+ start:9665 stop:10234 length:570 start_codon:yes stop_codon:yes gene_type:complete
MRIVSGSLKGKKIISGSNSVIRPTSDKVKMAIFNIIAHRLVDFNFKGKNVLDLFSGTGALGIEALSRGASFSTFVDFSKLAEEVCLTNLENCNLSNQAMYINCDIKKLSNIKFKDKFDIIFADPPYKKNYSEIIFKNINKSELLKQNGILIIEEDKNINLSIEDNFELLSHKEYGGTQILILIQKSLRL